jgi:DNA-binding HxlR family transcriptional regulator
VIIDLLSGEKCYQRIFYFVRKNIHKYALTDRGYGLRTILKALASWGLKNFPGTKIFLSVRDKKQQIHEQSY